MYNSITVDRSLFYVEQHHIDTFLSLAQKMEEYNYIIQECTNESAISEDDSWIIAFHTWLLLLPDEHHIILSVEKTLYYSSGYVIYNNVKHDPHFQNLKKKAASSNELLYLASLFIARSINKWVMQIYERYNLMYILERKEGYRYFDTLNAPQEEIQLFLEEQSAFVKAAIKELHTNSLTQMIKKSCDQAYFLYEELLKTGSFDASQE